MLRSLFVCAMVVFASVSVEAQDVTLGIQGTYAFQQQFGHGPSSRVRLVIVEPHLTVVLVGDVGHPRLELVNALVFGQSTHPGSRFVLGITDTFRVHFRTQQYIGPYLEAGVGLSSSALRVRELNGWLQYVLQMGTGLHIRLKGNRSLGLGYRFLHLSNNDTRVPNEGLNCHAVVLRFSFALK